MLFVMCPVWDGLLCSQYFRLMSLMIDAVLDPYSHNMTRGNRL